MCEMKTVRDFMRCQLVTLDAETCVLDGIGNLLRHNISGAPVVDRSGAFLGVFSEKCSMSALTGVLEIGFESGTYVPPVKSFMRVAVLQSLGLADHIPTRSRFRILERPIVTRLDHRKLIYSFVYFRPRVQLFDSQGLWECPKVPMSRNMP